MMYGANRRAVSSKLGLAIVFALLGACSGISTDLQQSVILSEEKLLAGAPILEGRPPPSIPDLDILDLTPEMKAFVDFYVDAAVAPRVRLRQLQSAVIHNSNFRVNYTGNTYTAEQTFRFGDGNCLSFTNMFIAMARYINLRAEYQEVDVPPFWESEGGTMVLNRHVNVRVVIPNADVLTGRAHQVVDFNSIDVKPSYDNKRVTDRRGAAHFFSNIGVDYLQAGKYRESFAYLRKSLRTDATLNDTWINLGALYSRVGALDYAESAYLTAVRRRKSMIGLSNLANLYQRMGNQPLADLYAHEVARFRAQNPYYRYYLAKASIEHGDYAIAVDHLERAIDLKPKEDAFYFMLGVAQLQMGQRDLAMVSFEEAKQVAVDSVSRLRYGHKIQRLLRDPNSTSPNQASYQ